VPLTFPTGTVAMAYLRTFYITTADKTYREFDGVYRGTRISPVIAIKLAGITNSSLFRAKHPVPRAPIQTGGQSRQQDQEIEVSETSPLKIHRSVTGTLVVTTGDFRQRTILLIGVSGHLLSQSILSQTDCFAQPPLWWARKGRN